ncbi:Bcr/CflA family efflux MFS transporter [Euzebya tangerina]|uniref:Bcr/CflA family efflux MFS transporter n=1 Tax=Euzebya tangerina TaxID=591198 RepID=UPI000E318D3F|nr:Bcr/CflA family efflux MFS transporter [Euzebya tangerina]
MSASTGIEKARSVGGAGISDRERTVLLAMSMALVALGIDLLLPAFPEIRADLGLAADSNAVAGLVTTYFVGLAVGQPLFGPLSDQFGRKPLLHASFVLYGLGAVITAVAPSLPLLLAARFLWGLGAAGPRVLTIAIVRDRYEGEAMSRAMSLIMSIFILVPAVAPSLGALGVALVSWRWMAVACLLAGLAMLGWATRLRESLAPEHRRPMSLGSLVEAAKIVLSDRQTVLFSLAMTMLYGSFTSYIGSSELIYADVFDAEALFPILFGGVALLMGGAMLVNARFVHRFGSRRLSVSAMGVYLSAAALMVASAVLTNGRPPLVVYLIAVSLAMGCHAILIPNLNAMAMIPMAAVAGMASSIIGAVQIAAGALIGSLIDRAFDGTVTPLSAGFALLGAVAAVLMGAGLREKAPAPAELVG